MEGCSSQMENSDFQCADYATVLEDNILCVLMKSSFLPVFSHRIKPDKGHLKALCLVRKDYSQFTHKE